MPTSELRLAVLSLLLALPGLTFAQAPEIGPSAPVIVWDGTVDGDDSFGYGFAVHWGTYPMLLLPSGYKAGSTISTENALKWGGGVDVEFLMRNRWLLLGAGIVAGPFLYDAPVSDLKKVPLPTANNLTPYLIPSTGGAVYAIGLLSLPGRLEAGGFRVDHSAGVKLELARRPDNYRLTGDSFVFGLRIRPLYQLEWAFAANFSLQVRTGLTWTLPGYGYYEDAYVDKYPATTATNQLFQSVEALGPFITVGLSMFSGGARPVQSSDIDMFGRKR